MDSPEAEINSNDANSVDAKIVAYKTLLREYINRRPSGIRKKISAAINTHRSFISQVANPNYRVPLPAQYVPILMDVCHFTIEEQETFLTAYTAAHPGQALFARAAAKGDYTSLTLNLSEIQDESKRIALSRSIREMTATMIRLVLESESKEREG